MWKQLLSKLPRKSAPKSDAYSGSSCGNTEVGSVSSNGNGVPSRSNTVKRTAAAIFPSSVVTSIEPLLSFRDVSSAERQNLFISKLNLCCVVFDFLHPNNSDEKDMKRQVLMDLIDYVENSPCRFTEPMISSSCKMFAVNLFRVFPSHIRSSTSCGETEEEEPNFDPAWSHLKLIYDFLLKFLESSSLDVKTAKKYIDHSFIIRLLDLFNSEDPRERDCLKTILHRIYGKFMANRSFIRKTVTNILCRFLSESDRFYGIAELLEVFGSVISGFAVPLKEEHKLFLWRTLIPLHKPKILGVYLQQLTFCVTQFVEKDPKLTSSVVKGLLRYWPVSNSQKELMFLSELEEVLETTNAEELQDCILPLFRRIAFCINSFHFQVAERALFLWNSDHVIGLVSENRQAIMPLILPALERNIQSHWNQAVVNLTRNVTKVLSEMDEELFLACKKKFEEEEENQTIVAEKRRMVWEHLETAAAFQAMTGNTAVLVMPAIAPPVAAALG